MGIEPVRGSLWAKVKVDSLISIAVPPGADLYESILAAATEAKVEHGTIVSGIGALGQSRFRNVKRYPRAFPVVDDDRSYESIEGPLELLSLVGWIAPTEAGKPYMHAHISASTVNGGKVQVYGGHLAPGAVKAWIMIVVTVAVHGPSDAVVGRDPTALAENVILTSSGPRDAGGDA